MPRKHNPANAAKIPALGIDCLNLSEFPIALISDRAPEDLTTLTFADEIFDEGERRLVRRTLTITTSPKHGLPTAWDQDLIVGLIQITHQAGFADRRVEFTKYELLQILGIADKGQHYQRISESFNRWMAVYLMYDQAWRDKTRERWQSCKFHIIDNAEIVDGRSTFLWNEWVFNSLRSSYIRKLDLQTYFSLRYNVSRRLYRFLGKRFFQSPECEFNLHTLAYEKVGMSRSYDTGQIKREIDKSLGELETVGFVAKEPPKGRYRKEDRKRWFVKIRRAAAAAPPPTGLETELVACGLTPARAALFVRSFPPEQIRRQIANLGGARTRTIRDPAAWLADAIAKDYAVPPPKGRRQATLAFVEARPPADPTTERIDRYWHDLGEAERAGLLAAALATATADEREFLGRAATRPLGQIMARRRHIAGLLGVPLPP